MGGLTMIINYAHGYKTLPYIVMYEGKPIENTPDKILNVFKWHYEERNSRISVFTCDKDVYRTISEWIDDNIWACYPDAASLYNNVMLAYELIPEEINRRIGMTYLVDIVDSAYYSENDANVLEYIAANNLERSLIKLDWKNGYLFYWIDKDE